MSRNSNVSMTNEEREGEIESMELEELHFAGVQNEIQNAQSDNTRHINKPNVSHINMPSNKFEEMKTNSEDDYFGD